MFDSTMIDYINKNLNTEYLVLCGRKGFKIDATIYHDYYTGETRSFIEDEWKIFCIKNNFKIGDMIRLKFARVNTSHMIHIFKIII
jgi:hypothetical protein